MTRTRDRTHLLRSNHGLPTAGRLEPNDAVHQLDRTRNERQPDESQNAYAHLMIRADHQTGYSGAGVGRGCERTSIWNVKLRVCRRGPE